MKRSALPWMLIALLGAGCAAPTTPDAEANDSADATGQQADGGGAEDAEAFDAADAHDDVMVLGPQAGWRGGAKRKWGSKWKSWQDKAQPDAEVWHNGGGADAGSTDDAADGTEAPSSCAADADAGAVPTPSCTPPKTTLFPGETIPQQQTLEVEIGHFAGDDFVPWQSGDARSMVHGPQGGLHVVAAARVRRKDGGALPTGALWLESVAEVACQKVTKQKMAWLKSGPAPGVEGARLLPNKGGVWLVLPAPASMASQWCGTWLRVTLRVKIKGTTDWGGASVLVHLVAPSAE